MSGASAKGINVELLRIRAIDTYPIASNSSCPAGQTAGDRALPLHRWVIILGFG
jgi:hypothetical protein